MSTRDPFYEAALERRKRANKPTSRQQLEAGLRRHNLTPEQYGRMLAHQGGCCAICHARKPGGNGRWLVDHDHECCPGAFSCGECARGLLCSNCNTLLGCAHDDPDVLHAAIEYLKQAP